jgi:superfamily II DNA/RNA helicase
MRRFVRSSYRYISSIYTEARRSTYVGSASSLPVSSLLAALERSGVECVIATPGRPNDLIEMRIKLLVLDEPIASWIGYVV